MSMGGGSSNQAYVDEQYEYDIASFNAQKEDMKIAQEFAHDGWSIAKRNATDQRKFQEHTMINEWEDKEALRVFDFNNQVSAYNASKKAYNNQVEFNDIAAEMSLMDADRKTSERLMEIGFQNQDLLMKMEFGEENAELKQRETALQQRDDLTSLKEAEVSMQNQGLSLLAERIGLKGDKINVKEQVTQLKDHLLTLEGKEFDLEAKKLGLTGSRDELKRKLLGAKGEKLVLGAAQDALKADKIGLKGKKIGLQDAKTLLKEQTLGLKSAQLGYKSEEVAFKGARESLKGAALKLKGDKLALKGAKTALKGEALAVKQARTQLKGDLGVIGDTLAAAERNSQLTTQELTQEFKKNKQDIAFKGQETALQALHESGKVRNLGQAGRTASKNLQAMMANHGRAQGALVDLLTSKESKYGLDLHKVAETLNTVDIQGQRRAASAVDNFGLAQDKFGLAREGFSQAKDKFGLAEEGFGLAGDQFTLAEERFSIAGEKYGIEEDRLDLNRDRFKSARDRFALDRDMYGLSEDKFARAREKFGLVEEGYGLDEAKYTRDKAQYRLDQNQFNLAVDKYGLQEERYGFATERYGLSQDKYGLSQRKFGFAKDMYGLQQERFDTKRQKSALSYDKIAQTLMQAFKTSEFGQAQLNESFGSAIAQHDSDTRKVVMDQYSADLQAHARLAPVPKAKPQASKPVKLPEPTLQEPQRIDVETKMADLHPVKGVVQRSPSPLLGIAGSIIGGVIAASDDRLKRTYNRVGTSPAGVPIYTFKYIQDGEHGPWYKGTSAQDLIAMGRKDAVRQKEKDGFYYVDYSKLDVEFEEVTAT